MSSNSKNTFVSAQGGSTAMSLALGMEQIAEPRIPDDATEGAHEDQAEREYLNLIRWAVRKAPDLLRHLRIAYLFGQHASAEGTASEMLPLSSAASTSPAALPSEKLKDIEREHIRRVLKASANVVEAARRLGINGSTLWRKRKRYNL